MNALRRDLDAVLDAARDDVLSFRGARCYFTGGTGFVGSWLLASIVHANARLGARLSVDVLTRDPDAFARRDPELAEAPGIRLLAGDVRTFDRVDAPYDAVVNAATPASANFNENEPQAMLDTIVDGQRATLAIAARGGAIPMLFTSSGAVYGRQPPALSRIPEEYLGGPDPLDPKSAYHEGKRVAELAGAIASAAGGPSVKVARLFAFVGPYLPLDRHFAIGNFLRDAMAGGPVTVQGDGSPVRSYLYASDLTAWLWAVFARGQAARPYNVGSEEAVDIAAIARLAATSVDPHAPVDVRGMPREGVLPERYVPDTTRARGELGVRETVPLSDALLRTIAWHRDARAVPHG